MKWLRLLGALAMLGSLTLTGCVGAEADNAKPLPPFVKGSSGRNAFQGAITPPQFTGAGEQGSGYVTQAFAPSEPDGGGTDAGP